MQCTNCAAEVPEQTKFCGQCGGAVVWRCITETVACFDGFACNSNALPQVGDMILYERRSSVSEDRSYLTL
jgi:predicted RNA-binding Zn-ribbon protein involved in translation (DUF1610 family)